MGEIEFNMPLLGTTQEEETFQYFLLKITSRSALIAIPSRFIFLDKGEVEVNLHVDGFLKLKKNITVQLRGSATKLPTSTTSEYLYRVEFEKTLPDWSFFHQAEKMSEAKMQEKATDLVKDLLLIKEGVCVYVKHIIPYFSRILTVSSRNYEGIKKLILMDTQLRIEQNIKNLEHTYEKLARGDEEFYLSLDLDALREVCKSEIDGLLLQLSFGGKDPFRLLKTDENSYTAHSYHEYLSSIKTLEHRLYRNYNAIIFIYNYYLKKYIPLLKNT